MELDDDKILHTLAVLPTGPGTWDVRPIIDGKPSDTPLAVLTQEGDAGYRVSRAGSDATRLMKGNLQEVVADLARGVLKAQQEMAERNGFRGFFDAMLGNMNVLAVKRDALPAFLDALSHAFADTIYEDIKPESVGTIIEVFGKRVEERLAQRGAKKAVMDALDSLVGVLHEAVKASEGEAEAAEAPKH